MPFASNTPGSKLDRAIVAYLLTLGAAYTSANTCPANYNVDNTYPNVTVGCSSWEASPLYVGNQRCQFTVRFEFSAVQAVGDKSQAARIALDAFVGAVTDALSLTDDNQTLNKTCSLINEAAYALAAAQPVTDGDLADFTMIMLMNNGGARGKPDTEGTAWVEEFNYIADIACVNCAQNQ